MAVSKRLRFEILNRDNHTCRYCGRTTPEVKLTIDHVFPVALGGEDKPENLVAACVDCNAGKTSSNPDAPLVDDVNEKAIQWSAAMTLVAEQRRAEREHSRALEDQFHNAWNGYTWQDRAETKTVPLDPNWRASIRRFFEAGLDIQDLEYALETAMAAPKVTIANTFKYFCGICWRETESRTRDAVTMLSSSAGIDAAGDSTEIQWEDQNLRHVELYGTSIAPCCCVDSGCLDEWCGDWDCKAKYTNHIAGTMDAWTVDSEPARTELNTQYFGHGQAEWRSESERAWDDVQKAAEKFPQLIPARCLCANWCHDHICQLAMSMTNLGIAYALSGDLTKTRQGGM